MVELAIRPVTFPPNSYPLNPLRLLRRFATRNDIKDAAHQIVRRIDIF